MIVLDEASLQKLKSIQVEMLKEFIRICKKYELRYYLVGGSCLGAVRHQGFIPWDDDIDIGMPRRDYQYFLKVAQKELCHPYFMQTHITDPDYPLNFAKIRNSETTFVESSIAHFNINHGVYLDIFPMDGYSDSRLLKMRIKRYKWGVEKSFALREWRSGFKKFFVRMCTLTLRDYHKARDRMNAAVVKYDYDKYDIVISHFGAWDTKEIFRKDIFGQGSKGFFEGMEVMLPADPDAYCRQLYGNYMEYPPIEKRVTHHHCDVIDLEKPYAYYKNKGND